MTYEEKKVVINAAKVLEEFCEEKRYTDECNKEDCLFHSEMFFKNCKICGTPNTWNVPTLTHWTPEDVALAKALKGFGVYVIQRWTDNELVGRAEDGLELVFLRRATMFKAFDTISEATIDTIISEAEGE